MAFDNGFDVCVVLTKGTRALAKQTFERIDQDFRSFVDSQEIAVYDILNLPPLSKYERKSKLIFVAKKQADNLDRLNSAFILDYPDLAEKRVLIIDDEADNASVGFNGPKEQSSLRVIADQIDELRSSLKQPAFLQVTATPYALYLQPQDIVTSDGVYKPVRPAFTVLVPVQPGYVGGDLYFPPDEAGNGPKTADRLHVIVSERELKSLRKKDGRVLNLKELLSAPVIETFRRALITFATAAAVRRLQSRNSGEREHFYSFLIHTDVNKIVHEWQLNLTDLFRSCFAEAARNGSPILHNLIQAAYDDLCGSVTLAGFQIPSSEDVTAETIKSLAEEDLLVTRVNGDEDVVNLLDRGGQLKLRAPMNVFIGGNILDRGLTINNLIGFYYGRSPNKFQQDTVLQHSRMYGFRPVADVAVTRFYTTPRVFEAMRRIQESDNALRRVLAEHGDHSVVFIQRAQEDVVSCSPNKIRLSNVTTLGPNKRILPVGFQSGFKSHIAATMAEIDADIANLQGGEDPNKPFQIPVTGAIKILRQIYSTLDFTEADYPNNIDEMLGALAYLSGALGLNGSCGQFLALWRGNRDIHRIRIGGRFSDKPESIEEALEARRATSELPILFLLRQEGRESSGWRGTPFYWPVLLAPENTKTALFTPQAIGVEVDEAQPDEDILQPDEVPSPSAGSTLEESSSPPPAISFSERESAAAYQKWGANCGPHTVAAIRNLSLHEVRKYFEPFPGSTNPTLMQKVLGALGIEFKLSTDLRTKELRDGIAYVQWEGSWLKPDAPSVARYRHTHWIAVRNGWVYDMALDSARWIKKEEWRPRFDAMVAQEYAGWHIWQHYAF